MPQTKANVKICPKIRFRPLITGNGRWLILLFGGWRASQAEGVLIKNSPEFPQEVASTQRFERKLSGRSFRKQW